MGKQSSRLIYRGKDIKDLVYQGNFLNKLYKGNDLVWEKLYRYFVRNTNLEVFDFDTKKYINGNFDKYSIADLKKGPTSAIARMYDRENARNFFAISYDMLQWKEVKELEYIGSLGNVSVNYSFMATYNGFFVYRYLNSDDIKINKLFFVEIDFDLEYTVKEVYSPDVFWRYISQYGVSDYFYGIQQDSKREYILHRVWKSGKVESKQLMGNFVNEIGGIGAIQILADENGNVFLICPDIDATNGGTVIFKVQNMDTERVYTAFWARNSEILNGSECGIDIVYDSYQTLFIAHRGYYEEKAFIEGSYASGGYYNMEFYVIDSAGNVIPTLRERDKEINIKCYGIPGREYLTIKFGGRKETGNDETPTTEGIIYFYNIRKGISSSRSNLDLNSVIFDYDKQSYENAFVGTYSWTDYYNYVSKQRTVVIFVDNLYMNESNGNFIVATKWEE